MLLKSFYEDIGVLSVCWCLSLSANTLLTFAGPLSSISINSSDVAAVATVSLFLTGTAFASAVSAPTFSHLGRKGGFILGCGLQMIGAIISMIGMFSRSIGSLLTGCFIVGVGLGFGHFYRFAVLELSPDRFKSWALSVTLSSGCVSGFLGPSLGLFTKDMFPAYPYAGAYLTLCLLGFVNLLVLLFMRNSSALSSDEELNPPVSSPSSPAASPIHSSQDSDLILSVTVSQLRPNKEDFFPTTSSERSSITSGKASEQVVAERRPFWVVVTALPFLFPCALTTLAQTVMFIVMSNVGLQMQATSYSSTTESLVFDLHFFFMFFPGFFTGSLVAMYGPLQVSMAGFALMAFPIALMMSVTAEWSYYVGMIFLGVSWNLAFTGGGWLFRTVLLSLSYSFREKAGAQAVNDVCVFGISSLIALMSGLVMTYFGWAAVLDSVMIIYGTGMAVALLTLHRHRNSGGLGARSTEMTELH